MIPSDILNLSYTPDMTEGGIAYACRSLACSYNRVGGSSLDHLRNMVGRVAVELAFRRYLSAQAIPFDVLGGILFTARGHYDVSIGGHRCVMHSYLITRRAQIRLIRSDPSCVLQAPALVQIDQFAAGEHASQDIHLFAFLLALTTTTQEDMQRVISSGQPLYLIHPLPDEWVCPKLWLPFEKLTLKSECEIPIRVEIGGRDARRDFVTATLDLPPRTRVPVEQVFHSLAYVHAHHKPNFRIGLHSSARGEPYIISPREWGNIWVYGMDILLTGWLTHEEYRRKAKVLNTGMHTFQYEHTRTKNLTVPIIELQSLGKLFEKVRKWEAARQAGDGYLV